jgi:hypothetical protein
VALFWAEMPAELPFAPPGVSSATDPRPKATSSINAASTAAIQLPT